MKNYVKKLIENVLALTGMDGMMHILVCFGITTYGLVYGFLGGLVAMFVAIALSLVKEFVIDDEFDLTDLFWDAWGIMIAFALYVPKDWLVG